ncbi:MAG: ACP S-malonyltransferase [Deltaproteobacteria bacterium]|nr:ACP S-malonyltransferase [Deltaproteobacteria bacterium]
MAPEPVPSGDYSVALMFPGQGSQFPGMALDIVRENNDSRETLALADEILGYSLSRIMGGVNGNELNQTVHTQPAIFVHSMLVWRLVENQPGLNPIVAAGHSLGEYSALCAAGALTFEDALRLVKVRAETMDKAQPPGTCGMAAVIGVPVDRIYEIVESEKRGSVLEIANYNSPDQCVISGTCDALKRAADILSKERRSRVVILPVSSAFHTCLMDSARESLKSVIDETVLSPLRFRVIANVNAEPYPDTPMDMKALLLKQLVSPVLWESCVRKMISLKASQFLEIGPGKVLSGLMRRIDRTVSVTSLSDSQTINDIQGAFA